MATDFRKVLLISSYAPPSLAGAPQFMYKLISTLPPESYTILTSFYNIDNISAKIGSWLPGEYIFYDSPGATKAARQEKEITPEEVSTNPTVKLKKFLRNTFLFPVWVKAPLSAAVKMDLVAQLKRLLKKNKLVKALLGAPLILGQIPLIIREGCRIVKEKNIELIVGFSDYGPAMAATYYIHRSTKIPFYLYLFDLYKGNFYPLTGTLLANWLEPRLIKSASKIIVTNEGTKEFYRSRYGNKIVDKIIVLYNSTNPKPYLEPQTTFQPHLPYTIVFVGNIYWPQIRSIKNLIRAIDDMPDFDIRLKIYTPQPKEYLKSVGIDSSKLELSVVPNSEMPRIQGQADILFLPLSWHTKGPDIINTATPGKLTEYMITGRPILIHAPASTFLVKYARDNHFAYIVDQEDIEELKTAIKRLLQDQPLIDHLAHNAKATFFKYHNADKNAATFHTLFLNNQNGQNQ
ncbi:MAG: glycosyltransferase [Patescibacteria group bacterium]